MSYQERIETYISRYPELKPIDISKLHKDRFSDINDVTYQKVFSRLSKSQKLTRISNGVYCKPKITRFGEIVSSEKDIVNYYTCSKENCGLVTGYRLFNKYKLTTQISKTVEVYSTNMVHEQKRIKNVKVTKININLNSDNIRFLELMEVLERYNKIEDLDSGRLKTYLKNVTDAYDDKLAMSVLKSVHYKKSTIASLQEVLKYFNVSNSLDLLLNNSSNYKTIKLEELNDIA